MSKNQITLIADPTVLAIPIKENCDPFIDLRDQNIIAFGSSPEIPNNTDYTKMRQVVYKKLLAAQSMLPQDLKFCLYEAYRSLELQAKLFDKYYSKQQQKHPSWNHEELFVETTKLVSPVINLDGSRNTPPHSTGAAIDIYLISKNGEAVDMGIQLKDWIEDLDVSLSQTDSVKISGKAQEYRAIMSETLTAVGFVNYPTEFWHWSYGDKYWALSAGAEHAFYDTFDDAVGCIQYQAADVIS